MKKVHVSVQATELTFYMDGKLATKEEVIAAINLGCIMEGSNVEWIPDEGMKMEFWVRDNQLGIAELVKKWPRLQGMTIDELQNIVNLPEETRSEWPNEDEFRADIISYLNRNHEKLKEKSQNDQVDRDSI